MGLARCGEPKGASGYGQNQELGPTRLLKVLAIEFGVVRTGFLETYPQEYPSSMRSLA